MCINQKFATGSFIEGYRIKFVDSPRIEYEFAMNGENLLPSGIIPSSFTTPRVMTGLEIRNDILQLSENVEPFTVTECAQLVYEILSGHANGPFLGSFVGGVYQYVSTGYGVTIISVKILVVNERIIEIEEFPLEALFSADTHFVYKYF